MSASLDIGDLSLSLSLSLYKVTPICKKLNIEITPLPCSHHSRRLHGLRRGHVLAGRAGRRRGRRRVAAVHHRRLGNQREEDQARYRYSI